MVFLPTLVSVAVVEAGMARKAAGGSGRDNSDRDNSDSRPISNGHLPGGVRFTRLDLAGAPVGPGLPPWDVACRLAGIPRPASGEQHLMRLTAAVDMTGWSGPPAEVGIVVAEGSAQITVTDQRLVLCVATGETHLGPVAVDAATVFVVSVPLPNLTFVSIDDRADGLCLTFEDLERALVLRVCEIEEIEGARGQRIDPGDAVTAADTLVRNVGRALLPAARIEDRAALRRAVDGPIVVPEGGVTTVSLKGSIPVPAWDLAP